MLNYVFNLKQFELTFGTTYENYMYAVESNSLSVEQIVPDTFSKIISDHRVIDGLPGLKFHTHCLPPSNPHMWYASKKYRFQCEDDEIASLMDGKKIPFGVLTARNPYFSGNHVSAYGID